MTLFAAVCVAVLKNAFANQPKMLQKFRSCIHVTARDFYPSFTTRDFYPSFTTRDFYPRFYGGLTA